MSPELIAILAVGAAIAGLMLTGQRSLRRDLGARIDGIDAKLTKRIDGVEAALTKRIDDVEAALTKLLERVETGQTELRERMAHLEGLLEGLREAIAHNRAA